jgi:hypothetical protein
MEDEGTSDKSEGSLAGRKSQLPAGAAPSGSLLSGRVGLVHPRDLPVTLAGLVLTPDPSSGSTQEAHPEPAK